MTTFGGCENSGMGMAAEAGCVPGASDGGGVRPGRPTGDPTSRDYQEGHRCQQVSPTSQHLSSCPLAWDTCKGRLHPVFSPSF